MDDYCWNKHQSSYELDINATESHGASVGNVSPKCSSVYIVTVIGHGHVRGMEEDSWQNYSYNEWNPQNMKRLTAWSHDWIALYAENHDVQHVICVFNAEGTRHINSS